MNRKIHLETLKDIIERGEKKKKKKTIQEQFLHQLKKYPIIPNVNIIGFFLREPSFSPSIPSKASLERRTRSILFDMKASSHQRRLRSLESYFARYRLPTSQTFPTFLIHDPRTR